MKFRFAFITLFYRGVAKMPKHKKLNILSRAQKTRIQLRGLSANLSKNDLAACKIELRFNREAIIDGCRGVADYNETRICLNVDKGLIVIEGEGLSLFSFDEGSAIVRGKFDSIGFHT